MVLDFRWQIKKVRKRGGEWQECWDGGFFQGKVHFLVCMLILLGWNAITANVGPFSRKKDPCNSIWLPSICHPCIDCHWKEYIALKSRCHNRTDLISINFHREFDIFFISEQHKLFKEDAGVANFPSHPLNLVFGYSLLMDTLAANVGGIQILGSYCSVHWDIHTHSHMCVRPTSQSSIRDPEHFIHKSFTFTVSSNSCQRLNCLLNRRDISLVCLLSVKVTGWTSLTL